MSTTLAILPARYASTRFPGKPLVDIRGKSMIRRVYEQCQQARLLDAVGVATDDERIFDHVKGFGGTVWMTSKQHRSGTDRVAEVANKETGYDFVLNVQGDEPLLLPEQIDALCQLLQQGAAPIATLATQITEADRIQDPNVVKLVRDEAGKALYFSRSPIPYIRDAETQSWAEWHPFWQHIGLYGFRRETLLELAALQPHPLEVAESLEQLRWLAYGYVIQTAIAPSSGWAVDTPEDLARLLLHLDQNAS